MEFKQVEESITFGQEWALVEFAKQPGCWAWTIWRTNENDTYKIRYYPDKSDDTISGATLRQILADWWQDKANQGNINYQYQHLLDLTRAYFVAERGNRSLGVVRSPEDAHRLKTALLMLIGA